LRWRGIQISFAVPIATGLILTTYFGLAAWRLSKDGELDITGQISARPDRDLGHALKRPHHRCFGPLISKETDVFKEPAYGQRKQGRLDEQGRAG
jgi:hypothetical protein